MIGFQRIHRCGLFRLVVASIKNKFILCGRIMYNSGQIVLLFWPNQCGINGNNGKCAQFMDMCLKYCVASFFVHIQLS